MRSIEIERLSYVSQAANLFELEVEVMIDCALKPLVESRSSKVCGALERSKARNTAIANERSAGRNGPVRTWLIQRPEQAVAYYEVTVDEHSIRIASMCLDDRFSGIRAKCIVRSEHGEDFTR